MHRCMLCTARNPWRQNYSAVLQTLFVTNAHMREVSAEVFT